MQAIFQVEMKDNVATALEPLTPGPAEVKGDRRTDSVAVLENIPIGHKVAVNNITSGDEIMKYGVVIGRATRDIKRGQWVHLHCMCSIYDERSSHLDLYTGAPNDIKYE